MNVTPNPQILHMQERFACNQSRHFLHYFHPVDWCVLWSWAHAVHCINADCSLPLKVRARGYLSPNLWSRVTSALSYRFNVPWHCNGSVPAPIKEQFVAEAEDYTWLRCHSLIAAKTDPRGFQDQDVYRPCTQTNKMCVTEQNPEMLIFLFAVALVLLLYVCWPQLSLCEWENEI